MKEIIGAIAIILTFVGYAPYIRDVLKGKTRPHAYSWFIWGFVTAVIFALQISANAGPGAFVTLATGLCAFTVFGLSLKYGRHDITRVDTVLFILALIATGIWIIGQKPVLSIVLLITIEMLGFAPTVRKSWNKPRSETLVMYQITSLRQALSILALQSYTIVTVLSPATWTVANLIFGLMLIVRRKSLRV